MPTVHPLPVNPTTGQQPLASLRSVGPTHSPSGVNREILKGLQDVAWSDEEDDPDCMVCAEPLDLSDQNFKPCPCGLQICQFCYHKLLRDDPRCPGCRRKYDQKSVVFEPVDFDEVRRVKEKKAKRAKITKQLETMGRRHLLETRIVMKNSLYVVGMKIPGSGSIEEAVSILRSNEFFGQYGKIARLYLRDRTGLQSPVPGPEADSPATAMGIYIVYVRREDAARAISSLDGIPAPQGPPGQILQASYGTTRYCESFLRSVKCDHAHCPNLHEWGGEGDSFTRTDLITALTRPAEYDARQKQSQLQPPPFTQKSAWPKPSAEDPDSPALPRTANWAVRPASGRPSSSGSNRIAPVGTSRPTKLASTLIPLGGSRSTSAFPPPAPSPVAPPKEKKEKKSLHMARGRSETSSVASLEVSASSGNTSPKKKSFTPVAHVTPAKSSSRPPPPGITPPPGLSPAAVPASTSRPATASPPLPPPKKKTSVPIPPAKEEPEQPEAGPSRPSTPVTSPTADYPIHSPYPDFDDIFTQPEARKQGFEFSLGLKDEELQRLLAFSHEVGGFEPSPFDPMLEQLPKLGIPLTSLIGVPRDESPMIYTGPFSPFAPSSPVETHSQPTSDEVDSEPRTTSRFDFARRQSVTRSPFRREEWNRNPNSNSISHSSNGGNGNGNGTGFEERPQHFHPALAQLNSQPQPPENWEYPSAPATAAPAPAPYRSNSAFGQQPFYYGSPQREMYSPAAPPPGYDFPSPYGAPQGMFTRRF